MRIGVNCYYGTYPGAVSDPLGATAGSYRVFRGGSWADLARGCRVACRNYDYPDYAYGYLGFRVVLTPSQ